MEAPKEPLTIFSSILLQEYVRLMTAAKFIKNNETEKTAHFKISAENYDKMMAEPLKTALLGLSLEYNREDALLSATPDDYFIEQFNNKIMCDVALTYAENYGKRYTEFMEFAD